MALTAIYTGDRGLNDALHGLLGPRHAFARTPSWEGLRRLVRERPVTLALVDLGSFQGGVSLEDGLTELRESFPSLGIVALVRRPDDPVSLFRLGRAGIPNLVLLEIDELERRLPRALGAAAERGAAHRVLRTVTPHIPRREAEALHIALDGVHHRWHADTFAGVVGYSRPFLSERLKDAGLPSTGHLLVWVRLLHAGLWLAEPGRTAESVSRQLEYSSGAAFRRALKSYTGATPTRVIERGGLDFVLDRFQRACRFSPSPRSAFRVA